MGNRSLRRIIDKLRQAYGSPSPSRITDPFEMVLYESVAYLVADEHRDRAFENLRSTIGLSPDEILAASRDQWQSVAELAGSNKRGQIAKMIKSAEIVRDEFDGDLSQILTWPFKKAIAALRKFPAVGEPSAEKILLFNKAAAIMPFESNGLRVVVRIGFAPELSNYSAMYRAAQRAVMDDIPADHDWLITAYHLLRKHGQTICKRATPQCEMCVVRPDCDFGRLS